MIYAITKNGTRVTIPSMEVAMGASYANCEIHLTSSCTIPSMATVTDRTLVMDRGAIGEIAASTSISIACPVVMMPGSSFTLTGDLTLTGGFSASDDAHFTGDGALTGLKEARPEWFEAAGNDTSAVQRAVDSVIPGGNLVASKNYLVTSINITSPLKIIGNGTFTRTTVVGSPILNISSSDVDVSNLHFVGAGYGTNIAATNTLEIAIFASGGDSTTPLKRLRFSNNIINGIAGFGIYVKFASNTIIDKNDISYCGYAGIMGLSIIDSQIVNNMVDSIGSLAGAVNWYGISATRDPTVTTTISARSTNVLIEGNIISNIPAWTGIDTHGVKNVQILNNRVYYCKNGIYAQYDSSTDLYKQPSDDVIIRGNIVEGNSPSTSIGIASLGLNNTMPNNRIDIVGNNLQYCGDMDNMTGSVYGINTNQLNISDNSIYKSTKAGIVIGDYVISSKVKNNVINGVKPGTVSSAIYMHLTSANILDLRIESNKFMNITGDAAFTPVYGYYYTATNTGITMFKNRMVNDGGAFLHKDGGANNVYSDFTFELEPLVNTGSFVLTEGDSSQEIIVTFPRTFSGTEATNTAVAQATLYTNGGNTKIALGGIGVVSATQYTFRAYTSDNTNIANPTTITVNAGIQSILW